MTPSAPKPNPWTRRLRTELRRDKKKTALLVVLLAAGGIVAGRLVVTHSVPTPAGAAPPAADAPRATARGADAGPLGPAAGDAQPSDERVRYLARLDRTIRRDLFRANLECFPPLAGQDARPGESGWFGAVYQRLAGAEDPGAGSRRGSRPCANRPAGCGWRAPC